MTEEQIPESEADEHPLAPYLVRATGTDQSSAVDQLDAEPVSSAPVRIALWGGVSSGKTLFAGALQVAVNALGARAQGAGLRSIPHNADARSHMLEALSALSRRSRLPAAGVNPRDLRWIFSGKLQDPEELGKPFHRPSHLHRSIQFELDLRDPPGIDFQTQIEGDLLNDSVKALIRADGIIYLFDPIAAQQDGQFETFFVNTLAALSSHSVIAGRADRYLPQRLAVCVTKFDDERVFSKAVAAGLVFGDQDGNLRVPTGQYSRQFFELLCRDTEDANALHLLEAVQNNFRPKSVRYYISSALGFSAKNEEGRSSWPGLRRYPNVQDTSDGFREVCEQARPINVIEPLLYLVRQTRRDRARVARRFEGD